MPANHLLTHSEELARQPTQRLPQAVGVDHAPLALPLLRPLLVRQAGKQVVQSVHNRVGLAKARRPGLHLRAGETRLCQSHGARTQQGGDREVYGLSKRRN